MSNKLFVQLPENVKEAVQAHDARDLQGPVNAPDEAPDIAYVVSLCSPIVHFINTHIRSTALRHYESPHGYVGQSTY